ncbi:hypothetical protein CHS0354_029764 [Potamilus streckersoni]|uniref:Uncharacterized protein n=1 Tax=Potamilus streckersoni TaxID=2493646 RepID=A0AAE0TIM3_9BIVA|nr:hypothetical protein CHS0354_029764 [Potamilus streckersoni]
MVGEMLVKLVQYLVTDYKRVQSSVIRRGEYAFDPNKLMDRYMNLRTNQATFGSYHPHDMVQAIDNFFKNGGSQKENNWGLNIYNPNKAMPQYLGHLSDSAGSLVPGGSVANPSTQKTENTKGYTHTAFDPNELNQHLLTSMNSMYNANVNNGGKNTVGYDPDKVNSASALQGGPVASAFDPAKANALTINGFDPKNVNEGLMQTAQSKGLGIGGTNKGLTNNQDTSRQDFSGNDKSSLSHETGQHSPGQGGLIAYNPDEVNADLYNNLGYNPDSVNYASLNMPSNNNYMNTAVTGGDKSSDGNHSGADSTGNLSGFLQPNGLGGQASGSNIGVQSNGQSGIQTLPNGGTGIHSANGGSANVGQNEKNTIHTSNQNGPDVSGMGSAIGNPSGGNSPLTSGGGINVGTVTGTGSGGSGPLGMDAGGKTGTNAGPGQGTSLSQHGADVAGIAPAQGIGGLNGNSPFGVALTSGTGQHDNNNGLEGNAYGIGGMGLGDQANNGIPPGVPSNDKLQQTSVGDATATGIGGLGDNTKN